MPLNLLKYNMTAAQLLLTLNDSEDRQRYLNTKQTINSLLKMNIIKVSTPDLFLLDISRKNCSSLNIIFF